MFQLHQYMQNTSDYIPEHFSTVSQNCNFSCDWPDSAASSFYHFASL